MQAEQIQLQSASTFTIICIFTVLVIIFVLTLYGVVKKNNARSEVLQTHETILKYTKYNNTVENKTLKIVLIISTIVFIGSGFLSYLNLYFKNSNDFFKIADYFRTKDLKSTFSVEGRISGYVKHNNGRAGFFFNIDKLVVGNGLTKSTGDALAENIGKEFKMQNEVYVLIKNSAILPLVRDDFISFNFELPEEKNYRYISTFGQTIKRINPENKFSTIFSIRQRFYGCISNIFYKSLSYKYAAISEALILGNRYNLSGKVMDDFKKSGIYHLLSISGLHISFFIVIVCRFMDFLFLKVLLKKHKNQKLKYLIPVIIISVLFLYNFIVGQKASMLRATLMSIFIVFANSWAKDFDRKYILSITFILLLIFNPEFFMDSGFWLSFASLFAIVYINGPLRESLQAARRKIRKVILRRDDPKSLKSSYLSKLFVTTLSVNLFIFPIIVLIFGEFSFLSFFTNIAAIPLSYVLLFVLISSAISGLFWPVLGILLIKPAKILIFLLLRISVLWRSMDFAVIKIKGFGIFHLAAYYFFLICLLLLLYKFTARQTNTALQTSVKNKVF